MSTCPCCGIEYSTSRPAVPTVGHHYRRSPKHEWQRTYAPATFCAACRTTPTGELTDVGGLARPGAAESIPQTVVLAECEHCQAPTLIVPHPNRARLYCSEACRHALMRAQRRERARESEVRSCQQCGEPMTGRADRKYCSARCRVAAHRAKGGAAMTDFEMVEGFWTSAKELRSQEALFFLRTSAGLSNVKKVRDQLSMSLEAIEALIEEMEA